jgi:hypothetical protein
MPAKSHETIPLSFEEIRSQHGILVYLTQRLYTNGLTSMHQLDTLCELFVLSVKIKFLIALIFRFRPLNFNLHYYSTQMHKNQTRFQNINLVYCSDFWILINTIIFLLKFNSYTLQKSIGFTGINLVEYNLLLQYIFYNSWLFKINNKSLFSLAIFHTESSFSLQW